MPNEHSYDQVQKKLCDKGERAPVFTPLDGRIDATDDLMAVAHADLVVLLVHFGVLGCQGGIAHHLG